VKFIFALDINASLGAPSTKKRGCLLKLSEKVGRLFVGAASSDRGDGEMDVQCALECRSLLGDGLVWEVAEQRL
jgi:hypothetical protein